MAYKNTIPTASDLLSQSQDDILNNFAGIKTLVDVNHVTFDAAGEGKHSFVQFPVQSPVPTTGVDEVGLYCQTSTLTEILSLSSLMKVRAQHTNLRRLFKMNKDTQYCHQE